MSIGDVLVLAALLACVWLAARRLRRGGGGCSGCTGDCASCRKHKK